MKTIPGSLHIGVIRGGISPEYETSLKNGAHILDGISESHKPYDILISKAGVWHLNGLERSPERVLKHVDVVFNMINPSHDHSDLGAILKSHGVKVIGSPWYEGALARNKISAKDHVGWANIKTPIYIAVRRGDSLAEKAKEIWESLPHPLVVKPANVEKEDHWYKVKNFEELLTALENVLAVYDTALAEEFITGKSTTCLVTENFRDQALYAFPPTGLLSKKEKEEVENLSRKIHDILKLRMYSAVDFVVSPKRGVYFLAAHTTPHIHKNSPLHEAIESVGVKFKDFWHHLVGLAMNR